MRTQQELLLKLAQGQANLEPLLVVLAESKKDGANGQSTTTLKSIEAQLKLLLKDQSTGRQDAVQEVRNEIRLLARTIAALPEGKKPR